MSAPRLEEVVGADVPASERDRLARAHDLLAGADAPPELPPDLVAAPAPPRPSLLPVPRRYRSTAFIGAVIVALALLGIGYLLGGGGDRRQDVRTVTLAGAGVADGRVAVLEADAAGNWPIELEVDGLAALPGGRTYELRLTPAGKPERVVGTFNADGEELTVTFSVPTPPAAGDRWTVVVVDDGLPQPVLRGTAG